MNGRARAATGLRWGVALVAVTLAGATPAQPVAPSGAVETFAETAERAVVEIPVRGAREGGRVTRPVEGRVTRRAFRVDDAGSGLAFARAVEAAFAARGFRTVLDCAAAACGGFSFRSAIDLPPPPAMRLDLAEFQQITMRKGDDWASVIASRAGAAVYATLTEVVAASEAAADPAPARPAFLDDLWTRLDSRGAAVLEGVGFEPGSTRLTARADRELDRVAAALAGRPEAELIVVGHTDASGPLDVNMEVSRARAAAVRAALVARGVDGARLRAEGVGWLSPRASNADEAGRARNRRVELVAR